MKLRVISGSARGKRLEVPKGNIRPLSERAREALFNILAPRIAESDFLDLFAGSGAVGIEALSRGARISIFAEMDKKSVPVIWANLENAGFSDRAEVYALPVSQALKILNKKSAKFDIIFLGAPYGSPSLNEALKVIGTAPASRMAGLLKPSAVVIAEHRSKQNLEAQIGELLMFRQERYGDTMFSFYKGNK